jgi:hypothetical protein
LRHEAAARFGRFKGIDLANFQARVSAYSGHNPVTAALENDIPDAWNSSILKIATVPS